MALKATSKILNEVTYSWAQFTRMTNLILARAISKLKVRQD